MDLNNKNDFFEEIINFSNKFIFEKIFTCNEKITEVFKVIIENKKYILKINKNQSNEEFNLVINLINHLNQNNFPTPKLLYSKYFEQKSYFIFDYIKNEEKYNIFNENHLIQLTQILNQFYTLSEKIEKNKKIENQFITKIEEKLNLENQVHSKILFESINEIKKTLKQNNIIIEDINPDNILINNKIINIIDFDLVSLGELELDMASLFVKFIPDISTLETKLNLFSQILNNLNIKSKIDLLKIINYIILLLYQESVNKNVEIQKVSLNNIIMFYQNKEFIIKQLESRLN